MSVVPGGGARTSSLPSVFFSSALGLASSFFLASAFGLLVLLLGLGLGLAAARLSWRPPCFGFVFLLGLLGVVLLRLVFRGRTGWLLLGFGAGSSFLALRPGMVKSRLG